MSIVNPRLQPNRYNKTNSRVERCATGDRTFNLISNDNDRNIGVICQLHADFYTKGGALQFMGGGVIRKICNPGDGLPGGAASVRDLKRKIDRCQAEIDRKKGDADAVARLTRELEKANEELKARISQINSEVDTLTGEINKYADTIIAKKEKVQNQERFVSRAITDKQRAKGRAHQANREAYELRSKLESAIKDNDSRLQTKIQSALSAATNKVTKEEEEVRDCESSITKTETSIKEEKIALTSFERAHDVAVSKRRDLERELNS